MRYLVILLALAGCATPLTPEQQAARLIAKFGPLCEQLGHDRSSDGWRNCVMQAWTVEIQQEQANAATSAAAAANVANVQRAMQQRPVMCTAAGCR